MRDAASDTSSPQSPSSAAERNAARVAQYLSDHPQFFTQHPDLLVSLQVATQTGDLTNLSGHQIKTLQQKNQQLQSQINQLIHNAQQSEALMNRLVSLLTALSAVRSEAWLGAFVTEVDNHFSSEYFQVRLRPELISGQLPHVAEMTADLDQAFAHFQDHASPLSGRLKSSHMALIFDDAKAIKSAIVLPVGEQAKHGLLAFASSDEDKFHPHMASDILQKLAAVLAAHCDQQAP